MHIHTPRLKEQFPLPAGHGVLVLQLDGKNEQELCVSKIEKLEVLEDYKRGLHIRLYHNGGYIWSTGENGISKFRDMYYRALRGEIAKMNDYDDEGQRIDGTPLINTLADQQKAERLRNQRKEGHLKL